MKADREYVKRKYAEFNKLCFGGKLPEIPVRITRARTYLGQLRYVRKRRLLGGWATTDHELVISNLIDRDESVVEDTIIHEMIHFYILFFKIKDTSTHGKVFRTMMTEINRLHNRHITVSHRSTEEEKSSDTRVRAHLLCVLTMSDGGRGIFVAMRSSLFKLWDMLEHTPSVADFRWYLTFDTYYNRFPRVKTLKYHRLDVSDGFVLPSDARLLVREGNSVRIAGTRDNRPQ